MKYILIAFMFSIVISCNNEPNINYNEIGNRICSCSFDLNTKNLKFEKLIAEKKQELAINLMDSLDIANTQFQACLQSENEKVKLFQNKNYLKKISKAIVTLCPDRAVLINQILNDEKWSQ